MESMKEKEREVRVGNEDKTEGMEEVQKGGKAEKAESVGNFGWGKRKIWK